MKPASPPGLPGFEHRAPRERMAASDPVARAFEAALNRADAGRERAPAPEVARQARQAQAPLARSESAPRKSAVWPDVRPGEPSASPSPSRSSCEAPPRKPAPRPTCEPQAKAFERPAEPACRTPERPQAQSRSRGCGSQPQAASRPPTSGSAGESRPWETSQATQAPARPDESDTRPLRCPEPATRCEAPQSPKSPESSKAPEAPEVKDELSCDALQPADEAPESEPDSASGPSAADATAGPVGAALPQDAPALPQGAAPNPHPGVLGAPGSGLTGRDPAAAQPADAITGLRRSRAHAGAPAPTAATAQRESTHTLAPGHDAVSTAPAAPNPPALAFGLPPTAVFDAPLPSGLTTAAETAQQHERAWAGVAAGDASQARVWQVELPVGSHADPLQLTVAQHFEAGAAGRAEAVWALSLPAHRHARAALDALKLRLQRRGLSVSGVDDDAVAGPGPRREDA